MEVGNFPNHVNLLILVIVYSPCSPSREFVALSQQHNSKSIVKDWTEEIISEKTLFMKQRKSVVPVVRSETAVIIMKPRNGPPKFMLLLLYYYYYYYYY